MIVPMRKLHAACRLVDRQSLLDALADLGVLHVEPIDPAAASPTKEQQAAIDQLGRALQVLAEVQPREAVPQDRARTPEAPVLELHPDAAAPALSPLEAAQEVLRIQRENVEHNSRLTMLHHQIEQLSLWGEMKLSQVQQLRDAGVAIQFVAVPARSASQVRADLVEPLGTLPDRRLLLGIIDSTGAASLPDDATLLPLPPRDRPGLREEAHKIEQAMQADGRRLAELAQLAPQIRQEQAMIQEQAKFTRAGRSGMEAGTLFAIKGWVPTDQADTLPARLQERKLDCAAQFVEPQPNETPPTLIRYPRWAKPIKGLFEILGTSPGYNEMDISGFFMLSLPIFAAMLIGDAAYGVLFTVIPLLFYRKFVALAGAPKVNLLISFGVAAIIWGMLTATYFGITPDILEPSHPAIADAMKALAPLWRPGDEGSEWVRNMMMKISLFIGAIHLTVARIRKAIFLAPSQPFLAEVGWAIFLWGMLGVIWLVFFGSKEGPLISMPLMWTLLGAGFALVILFSYPSRNPAVRIGVGLASNLLPVVGAFGDTISYIRLMAVGLASYYIAFAFNSMAANLASSATWFVGAPVAVFGHLLNIALIFISIFAHGVRLNMLEFSSSAGVQWAGYPYEPFRKSQQRSVE